MKVWRAPWVLPIAAAPIRDGWVAVDAGRVVSCGGPANWAPCTPDEHVIPGAAILPALVNAHTHLELSHLRGRVPPAPAFSRWVGSLMAMRRRYPDAAAEEIVAGARAGIDEARAAGTGLVGDVSNTLISAPLLREAGLPARIFHELLGFNATSPDAVVEAAMSRVERVRGPDGDLQANITAHAPYTVSGPLFQAIAAALAKDPAAVASIHVAESPEEVEFLQTAAGGIRNILDSVGVWVEGWTPPRQGPLAYIASFGLLTPRLVAVHGVQLQDDDLATLAAAGATLVTCPRSNRWVGAGDPDVARFYASGVRVAIGTDSLASVDDLNLFAELARIRALAPALPAGLVLDSATRRGAEALGFGADFGTLERGKRASLIAVRVPEGVDDVEEYLLSGIGAPDITWLNPEP